MVLSNTATPVYYEQFRNSVLRGDILVCREVAMEMERIDENIANPNFYYDEQAVEGFIRFCEAELTLTDGDDLRLLPTFKLWAESIFGWYYFVVRQVQDKETGEYHDKVVKRRLVNKQYLIVARGAAKSLYESCLQAYFLVMDTTTTHQITVAPTMKQAEEIMGPIRTAITRARGPVFKFLTEGSLQNTTGSRFLRQKLVATKKGIENFMTNSFIEIRAMTIDKLQGLRTKMSTVDEWLSGDLREDVVGAIEQGAAKVIDYLIVAVSSEGTVRNGAGDDMKLELASILRGDYYNPRVSIWWYKLDDVKEVEDSTVWHKAQPNLDRTVSYETYELDVERAEKAPANRNDILAKRFGIPMTGHTYFFVYAETIPHRPRVFWDMPCAMGADLSRGDDFCAFTFLFPLRGEEFGVKTRSYITELTLKKLPGSARYKYQEFIDEGTLHIMDGAVLDMIQVYEDLDQHIAASKYDVRAMGYDPYGSDKFVERWTIDNGPHFIEKVAQGARTESIPLGEIKKMAGERLLLFDEELMSWTMSNCAVEEDNNGNKKLFKKRQDEKIDNVAALMDAYVAFKANKENFE